MNFNCRVKTLGYTMGELLAMGFAVNNYDCEPGEHWAITGSEWDMERMIKHHNLKTITQPETVR